MCNECETPDASSGIARKARNENRRIRLKNKARIYPFFVLDS